MTLGELIDSLHSEHSVVAFVRSGEGEQPLIFVCNFTPVPREGYRLGLAESGPYREVLNSDEEIFRGSGVGNGSEVMSEPIPAMVGRIPRCSACRLSAY